MVVVVVVALTKRIHLNHLIEVFPARKAVFVKTAAALGRSGTEDGSDLPSSFPPYHHPHHLKTFTLMEEGNVFFVVFAAFVGFGFGKRKLGVITKKVKGSDCDLLRI